MTLSKNLAAGLFSSFATALLTLVVAPIYIHWLGVEAYALIGICVTLQTLMQLLDFGLAPTVNREVASGLARGDLTRSRNLLGTLAWFYWVTAGCVAFLGYFAAHFAADNWISAQAYQPDQLAYLLFLMGLAVSSRWPGNLYGGAMLGANQLGRFSFGNLVALSVSHFGAILSLSQLGADLAIYFYWQIGCGLLLSLYFRAHAWRTIGSEGSQELSWEPFRSTMKFSLSMGGVALTSIILTQLDKVILSKLLPLQDYGYYMLAFTASRAVYVIVNPVFSLVYPRFSALHATGNQSQAAVLYRLCSTTLASVLFPIAALLMFFGKNLLVLWVGDPSVAQNTAILLGLLGLGSALHGVMYVAYAMQLGFGASWLPLMINVALILLMGPLIVLLVDSYGAIGAASAWIAIEVIYFASGTFLTLKLLKHRSPRLVLVSYVDVLVPLSVSMILIGFVGNLLKATSSHFGSIFVGVVLAILSVAVGLLSSPLLLRFMRTRDLSSMLVMGRM
ncbi:MAG: oligosaccharide flippase family protein [Planctomycetales bacterium]|nr:oligosaccharide flippase family protein [Planctomycetales bacterium]